MKPMGYDKEEQANQALLEKQNECGDAEVTQIAYPEDRYGLACIGCGIEMYLQMIPHRNSDNILVGWVFSCERCRSDIIGRQVNIGEPNGSV